MLVTIYKKDECPKCLEQTAQVKYCFISGYCEVCSCGFSRGTTQEQLEELASYVVSFCQSCESYFSSED